jgi:hypothetical protein
VSCIHSRKKVSGRLFVCPLDQPRRPPSESVLRISFFFLSFTFFVEGVIRVENIDVQASIPNPYKTRNEKGDKEYRLLSMSKGALRPCVCAQMLL